MSGEDSPRKRQSTEQGSSSPKKKAKTTEDTANKVVLYSYWRSSCSWRVRTSLEWKGIKYEYIPVHLLNGGGEHLKEPFTSLNPNQRVPTLKIDGHTLNQSGAILEYLEETHPEKPLLPKDSFKRAQVRNICGIIGSDIQPVQNLGVLQMVIKDLPEEEKTEKKLSWGRVWIERGFVALEKELSKTAGKYSVGDTVTFADVYLEPQVYNAHRFKVDMNKFPTIARISKAVAELPAFKRSHPSSQPDAQPN